MLFDELLQEIGEFGWYQKRVYFLAAAPAVLVAFETLSVIFIFFIPDHRCRIPGYEHDTFPVQNASHRLWINRTIPQVHDKWDQCHTYHYTLHDVTVAGNASDVTYAVSNLTKSQCDSWVYDLSTFDSTIATDFDVVCQHNVYRASSNMLSEVGTLCGTFAIGIIADRFGRKIPFYLGGLALIAGGFGIAFTTNLITLNICRFILGIARMAVFVNGIVIGMEIVGPSKRMLAGILIELFWCLGEYLLLLIAYFIRNWRYLEIAVSIPSIGLLFYWWIIPESPRWLASRGRTTEALSVLKRISDSNKTVLPEVEDFDELMSQGDQLDFKKALKCKELLIRVLIVLSNMFVIVVVYYGLTLNITNLSGNVFTNFAISASMEVLAYCCSLCLLDRLGRKPVFTTGILLSGAACSLAMLPVILGMPDWTVVALSMVGRFAVCIAFATIYVYGAELFPTVVRSSAMGIGVTFSRFGSILSPFMADVGLFVGGRFKDALPLLVMGFPALMVGLLSLWLPETLHTTLPDTLQDLKRSKMKRKCVCCVSKPKQDNNSDDNMEEKAALDEKATTQC